MQSFKQRPISGTLHNKAMKPKFQCVVQLHVTTPTDCPKWRRLLFGLRLFVRRKHPGNWGHACWPVMPGAPGSPSTLWRASPVNRVFTNSNLPLRRHRTGA